MKVIIVSVKREEVQELYIGSFQAHSHSRQIYLQL